MVEPIGERNIARIFFFPKRSQTPTWWCWSLSASDLLCKDQARSGLVEWNGQQWVKWQLIPIIWVQFRFFRRPKIFRGPRWSRFVSFVEIKKAWKSASTNGRRLRRQRIRVKSTSVHRLPFRWKRKDLVLRSTFQTFNLPSVKNGCSIKSWRCHGRGNRWGGC